MSNLAVEVDHLWKNFRLYHERNRYLKAAFLRGRRARYEEFWAVKDVSLEIPFGGAVGIIGSNGSGKSTLLKCLAKILYPDKGSVSVNGRLAALLELGAGFHPELTGRENIFLNGAILGMTKKSLNERFDEIVEFSGLERFIDTPVRSYSSGMVVRLGFAIATNVEPEILLIDEVLAVGDQSFQRKSEERIHQFRKEGRTIIVVSHTLSQLEHLCQSIAWLDHGELVRFGPSKEVLSAYTGVGSAPGVENGDPGEIKRPGTKNVEIIDVEMIDSKGKSIEDVTDETSLLFRIQTYSHRPVENMMLKVTLCDSTGLELWSSTSRTNGLLVPKHLGENYLTVALTNLPMLSGEYSVSFVLTNFRETQLFDDWSNAAKFRLNRRDRLDKGIVAVDSTWSSQR